MQLYIPEVLFGRYNEVLKRLKILKEKYKNNISNILIIEEKMKAVSCVDLIVMTDNYISRKIKEAFFPFVFVDVLLFEECRNSSSIVKWYKNIATSRPWLLLSLLSDAHSNQDLLLCGKEYAIHILDSLFVFWDTIVSPGEVFYNSLLKVNDNGINMFTTHPFLFWQNNIGLKKVFYQLGVNIGLDLEDILSNFKIMWPVIKQKIQSDDF